MHRLSTRSDALALTAAGVNDCEVARRLGVPRTTVRDWRRRPYVRQTTVAPCLRCWRPSRPVRASPEDYAELLGLYLGDGYVVATRRTQRLRISLDARYPTIVADTAALLRRCFPSNGVSLVRADAGSTAVVSVYHGHLACVLPQHGPGKKHERPIVLEAWQRGLVDRAPWAFLRGCIRSDGCVFVNRTGAYRYLTYDFANDSADIRECFAQTCEAVGLRPRRHRRRVRLNRRADVAALQRYVGLKS
jgi:hypothetical protein